MTLATRFTESKLGSSSCRQGITGNLTNEFPFFLSVQLLIEDKYLEYNSVFLRVGLGPACDM